MALNAILVDRARVVRREALLERVDGETQFATVRGGWFRARLDVRTYVEQPGPGQGPPRVVHQPVLIYRDPQIKSTDRIEVESAELGTTTYQAAASPEPYRKKRRVIGYEVALKQVDDGAFTPLPAGP